MTAPDRWVRIEALYHAARDRSASERAAFLDAACGDDAVLRREVESLLAQPTSDDGFLGTPAMAVAAQRMTDSGASMLTGRRIGVYQIQTLLGAGGMGEVYLARDTRLGRSVAIKILPRGFATDPERLARFEREARMLAALNHPNIATIHGVEESNGVHALVLELVEGETLAEKLSARALPVPTALAIARQIADALDVAHEKGIVHRDLKPANIKITPDGTVKVLDFGLAKRDGREHQQVSDALTIPGTREGVVLGTAAYMSPEQARGQAVDKRTDIWAFGCVLYEMLTGRSPFARETLTDTLSAVIERQPDWEALPSETTPSVRRLVERCLAKDVRQRLRDIGDARFEIDELVTGTGSTEGAKQHSSPLPRRGRAIATVAIAGVVVSGAALALLMRGARSIPAQSGAAARVVAAQLTDYGGTERTPALSPDGRSFVFVSDHGGTPDLWLRQISGGEPVRLTNDAAAETDLAYSPDGELLYFTRLDGATESIWATGVLGGQPRKLIADAHTPSPAPNGMSLAYFHRETPQFDTLVVSTPNGGGTRVLAQHVPSFPAVRASWSSDGRRISFVRAGLFAIPNLFIVDPAGGVERQVTHFSGATAGTIAQHAWLPDNRHVVVSYSPYSRTQGASDLGILDIQDGSIARVTATILDGFTAPSVSADGSRVIATVSHQLREIWQVPVTDASPDVNGRAATHLLPGFPDPLWTFVTRDGRTLLFNSPASGSRNLWTSALDDHPAPRQITAVGGDALSHSSLSPDGSRVAFASLASGHSDLWTQNIDGSDLRQLTNDEAADNWPVWSPDGKSVVFASMRSGVMETRVIPAEGGANEKLIDGFFRGDWIRNPAGPGTWIVTSDGVDSIRLIDAEHRTIVWERRIAGSGGAMPVFTADGRSISIARSEGSNHDVVEVLDAATGEGHLVARLPFRTTFRASWAEGGKALIVNRAQAVSHIALFDRFWEQTQR